MTKLKADSILSRMKNGTMDDMSHGEYKQLRNLLLMISSEEYVIKKKQNRGRRKVMS